MNNLNWKLRKVLICNSIKKGKYSGINFKNEGQEVLYTKNYKTLVKETKDLSK